MKYSAFYLAIIYIIIWNVLFLSRRHIPMYIENEYVYLVALNLLFIIICIIFALYYNYTKGNEIVLFPDEMRAAMSAVSVYGIILSIFTYIFYKFIDVELIASILDSIEASLPIDQEILLDKGISEEEYIQENMANARKMISPFSLSTMMLVAVMATGMVYSFLFVFIRMKLLPLIFRK